jgi:hypothetical protein
MTHNSYVFTSPRLPLIPVQFYPFPSNGNTKTFYIRISDKNIEGFGTAISRSGWIWK